MHFFVVKIMGKIIDLSGQRFGRLTAVEPTERRCGESIVWRCLCECGNEIFVRATSLRAGHTQSCGCLSRDLTKKRFLTHGMTYTREYNTWKSMHARCKNPKRPGFADYGGRGIKVCERWNKFENFLEDMGLRPEGKTLDRWPDNDGDYELDNCRWATQAEQNSNARSISCGIHRQRWFFAFNLSTGEWFEDDNQSEFAREHELNPGHISGCLCKRRKTHKGWTFEFLT